MPKRFNFPDGTVINAPEDTTSEEAVFIYDNRDKIVPPPEPEPEPEEKSLLSKVGTFGKEIVTGFPEESTLGRIETLGEEFMSGPFIALGRGLEGAGTMLSVFDRMGIDRRTEDILFRERRFGRPLSSEEEVELRKRMGKIKTEGFSAQIANLLKEQGRFLQEPRLGKVPEEVAETSFVDVFEEEGLLPAAKLFGRKIPGFMGEQGGIIAAAITFAGPFSSASLLESIAPSLMKNVVLKKTIGTISPKVLAAGTFAGPVMEAPQTVIQVLDKGGTDEQAMNAFVEMAAGTAFLDSLGIGQFLRKVPKGAIPKLTRMLVAGGVEGLTEGLEEFVEADALARVGIEEFDFKDTLKQAIEVGLLSVVVGSTVSAFQQGTDTFSPETTFEGKLEELRKTLGLKKGKTPSLAVETSAKVVEELKAAKTVDEFDDVAKRFLTAEGRGTIKEFKRLADIARMEPGAPRPVDKEGNLLYEIPEETFVQLIETVRQPGQSVDMRAAEQMRAFLEQIIVVLAESKGVAPETFADEVFSELGIIQTVGKKPAPGAMESASNAAIVEAAIDRIKGYFGPKAKDNRSLNDVLGGIADNKRLSDAALFLRPVGLEIESLINEAGVISNKDVLAKLSSMEDGFRREVAEEEVRLDEEQNLQEEAPSGLQQFEERQKRAQSSLNRTSEIPVVQDIINNMKKVISGSLGLSEPLTNIPILDEVANNILDIFDDGKVDVLDPAIVINAGIRVFENSVNPEMALIFEDAIERAMEQAPDGLTLLDSMAALGSTATAQVRETNKTPGTTMEPVSIGWYKMSLTLPPITGNLVDLLQEIKDKSAITDEKPSDLKISDILGEEPPSPGLQQTAPDAIGYLVNRLRGLLKEKPPIRTLLGENYHEAGTVLDIIKEQAKVDPNFEVLDNFMSQEEENFPFNIGFTTLMVGDREHQLTENEIISSIEDLSEKELAAAFKDVQSRFTKQLPPPDIFLLSKEKGLIRGQFVGVGEDGAFMNYKEASKYLIRAFAASNITTGVHEIWHFAAVTAGGQLKTDIEEAMATKEEREKKKWAKIEDWTNTKHERWAKSGERYIFQGIPPSERWEKAFYIIKEKMALAYQTMRSYILPSMNPDVQRVFDHFFLHYGPGKALGELNESLNQIDKLMQETEDPIGKYYNNVNISEYDNDPVMKKAVIDMLDKIGGIQTTSDAEVMVKAYDLLKMKGAETFKKDAQKYLDTGESLDDIEIMAAAIMKHRLEATAYNLITKGVKGSKEYEKGIAEFIEILEIQADVGNEKGRGLRMMRHFGMSAEESLDFLNQVAKADPALIAQLENLDITSPEDMRDALKRLKGVGVRLFITAYMTDLLSSPKTIGINLFSTAAHIASLAGVRLPAAVIEAAIAKARGRPKQLYMKESWYLLTSLATVPFRGDGLAWRAAWAGLTARVSLLSPDSDIRKILTRFDDSVSQSTLATTDYFFEGFDSSKPIYTPKGLLGAFARHGRRNPKLRTGYTYALTGPGRLLFAFDLFLKAIPELSETTAIDYRLEKSGVSLIKGEITNESVLDAHIESERKMLGSTYDDLIKRQGILQELSGSLLSEGELKRAALIESYMKRRAEEGAFQTKPAEHSLTAWGIDLKKKRPLLGAMLVPFVRTLSSVAHVTVEYTPGAPLLELPWDKLGGDESGIFARTMPAELAVKQMLGLFVWLMLWNILDDEDRLTGPSPDSAEERESWRRQGKIANAIRLNPGPPEPGDKWYEYRRFEPFGTVLALAANSFRIFKRIEESNLDPAEEKIKLFEKLWFVSRDIGETMMNGYWAQGALDLIGVATGGVEKGRAKRTTTRFSSGFLPYSSFWRYLNNAENQKQFGGQPVEDDATILQYMSQSMPFSSMFYSQREPGIDALGQKIIRQSQGDVRGTRRFLTNWTPFNYSILGIDEVEQQFIDAGLYPAIPKRKVNLGGRLGEIRLDEDIYLEYITQAGHDLKETIQRRLPSIRDLDPERKKRKLKSLFDSSRKRARVKAVREQRKRVRETASLQEPSPSP